MSFDDVAYAALAVALAAWLLVTIVCQVPASVKDWAPGRIEEWVRGHDLLGIVPRWHFFAPRPAIEDYHLLYRDTLPDGTVTRWTEVHPMPRPRWTGAMWNPAKRRVKALLDASVDLLRVSETLDHDTDQIRLTLPYIAFLNHVSSLERSYVPVATQFLLMRSQDGVHAPRAVFRSAMHRTEPVALGV